MIEVLKQAYQLLLTEPHAPTVCDQLEVIFRRAIAELESQEPVAWMKPDVLCDRACMYLCTKGFTQFPECATIHPPQRTEQEPVAWTLLLVGEHHGMIGKAGEKFLGHPEHYDRVDVYTHPQQRTEQNFCPRCGKRTNDIHTCTPPRENT